MKTIRAKQRGLSLISLMVALTIGSFLLAGLFDIWLQTRNTFQAQGSLAQLQDNERMALTMMSNTIQNGGYYPLWENYGATPPSPLFTTLNVFPAQGAFTAAGQTIFGTSGTAGASDTISVRYMSDGNALDCLGQSQPDQTLVTNTYSVSSTGYLTCQVTATKGGASTVSDSLNIISGVSLLTALYGVDPGSTGSVTQYMSAATVTSSAYWSNVRSVKLQLTFPNPLTGPGQAATLPTFERVVSIPQTTTSL